PAGQAAPPAAGRRPAAGRCRVGTGGNGGRPASQRLARRRRGGLSRAAAIPRNPPYGDRMKSIAHVLLVSLLAFAPAMAAPRDTAAPPALPPGVAIASGHELATDAGLEVLRQGGNAFDAARSEEHTSELQS